MLGDINARPGNTEILEITGSKEESTIKTTEGNRQTFMPSRT
jgi:hypothetical protein